MRVILLGPPGSGKGTQSKLLCERNDLVYLGTGVMLRDAVERRSPSGERARPFVDAGQLVPDALVNELVAERLMQPDRPERFLIDGYPRTVAQAVFLDRVLESRKLALTAVLVLRVPDEEIVRRLSGRGRSDDGVQTVRARLDIFRGVADAIAAHYRPKGILHEVTGVGEVEQVYNSIMQILGH